MTKRDPNLDHAAVIKYRDVCRLTANWFQRKEIVATFAFGVQVLGSEQAAKDLWEATLKKFMLEGNNPKRVDWIMDRFEERVRKSL
jgi:hypothetical protein